MGYLLEPIIHGSSVRRGTAYTYRYTVSHYNYLQLQRIAIIQGHIKVQELETLLLTHVNGRVIEWGVW